MVQLTVRTRCIATVEERWLIRVTEEQAARLRANPETFEDLLVQEEIEVIESANTDVYGEEDREVRSIE